MTRLRLGRAAARGAAPTVPFPGIEIPEPKVGRSRWVAGALAAVLHIGVFVLAFVIATMAPEPEEEVVIPVQLLHELPAPQPAAEPAPAPKALAERRSVNFNPAAQTVQPQVVNPTVVAQAAPSVAAERLDIASVSSSTAPTQISTSSVAVNTVKAVTPIAGVQPSRVDLSDAAAPALRGPIQPNAPVGPSVGPRKIASGPSQIGTGPTVISDPGSSVREGVSSTRDVLGTPDGPRLANVNTRVGTGNLRGPGGQGTTLGGIAPDCQNRPEVQAYMAQIRDRTVSRWAAQGNPPGKATLRFKLDVGGSTSRVELVTSDNPKVGSSVVDALRAASPFPPMSDRVRCLANAPILAKFNLSYETVAN